MQLSVIIVNHNVKHFLEQCLFSVNKAGQGIETEIFVVDNRSTDGSRERLEPLFPNVHFTWNDTNEGFAKANNRAVAQASGKYILFLNPDTIIPEDCLNQCFRFFEKHPDAGAIGVHMIDGSGTFLKESKRAFPSPMTSLYKLSGLAALFPHSKVFARYYLGHLNENENHEVDVLAGAFMMIPKTVLDKTGSFDERFFMYGEDVDLSYRIQQAGYKNYYYADTSIIHFKGESTKKGSLNYVRLFYKAMSLFVKKHYSGGKAGIFIFVLQLAIGFRAALAAVGGFFRNLFNTQKGKPRFDVAYKTLIVSNENTFHRLEELIQQAGMHERVLGRIRISDNLKNGALGNIIHLGDLIKQHDAKEIIFTDSELSFKEIIHIIRQHPASVRNKFHATGSGSIVGSDSKDQRGDYIA